MNRYIGNMGGGASGSGTHMVLSSIENNVGIACGGNTSLNELSNMNESNINNG